MESEIAKMKDEVETFIEAKGEIIFQKPYEKAVRTEKRISLNVREEIKCSAQSVNIANVVTKFIESCLHKIL